MVCLAACLAPAVVSADAPVAMYIFPAGGQRGTEVEFRVGGLYLHEECPFEMLGEGVNASSPICKTRTVWFEGPLVPLPDSQQAEDYPKDLAGRVRIDAKAVPGTRPWRVWTAQGATAARPFVVGDLPETTEQEIDGRPIPLAITLPRTINGRIFPREDIDIWEFEGRAGLPITCTALTTKLGSPFEPRLEIRDLQGRRLAESSDQFLAGADALVRFVPPVDGTYQVRIHDVKFGGLQHYVYRLTITADPFVDRVYPLGGRRGSVLRLQAAGTRLPHEPIDVFLPPDGPASWETTLTIGDAVSNRFSVELDDLPETLEQGPNDSLEQVVPVDSPVVFNGRIERPGDVDHWGFRAEKERMYEIDLRAARLGSPLDSMLILLDATGKELARSDDMASGQTDSQLKFTAPADGVFYLRVEDRLASRGGSAFAYRLRVASTAAPDFRIHLATDALSLNRGAEAKVKVRVERIGGFAGAIELACDDLPGGVAVSNTTIAANAGESDLAFKAEAHAPIVARKLVIRGSSMLADAQIIRSARYTMTALGEPQIETLLLAVCVPTPFKVKGVYEVKYAQRGSLFVRRFQLDRGGFDGPLEVRLADRQARHLQGVTGPLITVPARVTEFTYPASLPPWMEIGRTSRTVVMAVGIVEDPDGARHKVSFTSVAQNEQIVALIDPGQLTLDLDRQSLAATAGSMSELSLRVGRGVGVVGEVHVELILPEHVQGVSCQSLTIPADAETGQLALSFDPKRAGPFNMPLIVRATARASDQSPVIAEASLELVPPP
ncbi:MAG: PPC domain-containing protein [Planctomycetales bacterium]